jgi:hypothetical protein
VNQLIGFSTSPPDNLLLQLDVAGIIIHLIFAPGKIKNPREFTRIDKNYLWLLIKMQQEMEEGLRIFKGKMQ